LRHERSGFFPAFFRLWLVARIFVWRGAMARLVI